MQVKIDQKVLTGALARLKHIATKNPTVPLLGCVELTQQSDGRIRLRTNDLEIDHSVFVQHWSGCLDEAVLVDFTRLEAGIKLLSGDVVLSCDRLPPIEFVEKEKTTTAWSRQLLRNVTTTETVREQVPRDPGKVTLTSGKRSFSLPRWESDSYPAPPSVPETLETHKLDLAALVAPVLISVSTDVARYGLNGVCLETRSDGTLAAVSTDGHRLTAHRVEVDITPAEVILLPRGLCAKLDKVATGVISLDRWVEGEGGHKQTHIRISGPDFVIQTRCLDGDFPDWRQIIPRPRWIVQVDAKQLESAGKYLLNFATEKSPRINLYVRASVKSLTMTATNTDMGTGKETLDIESVVGEDIAIGVNGDYLLDTCKILGKGLLEIRLETYLNGFETYLNGFSIQAVGRDDLFCVLMPMRIANGENAGEKAPTLDSPNMLESVLKYEPGFHQNCVLRKSFFAGTSTYCWEIDRIYGPILESREACEAWKGSPQRKTVSAETAPDPEEAPW